MKQKPNTRFLLIALACCIAVALLSRFFLPERSFGWGNSIAAAVLSFIAFSSVSIFILKGDQKWIRLSRYLLMLLVAAAGIFYYLIWNNNVATVERKRKLHDKTIPYKQNIIIGKTIRDEIRDENDTAMQRLMKEKKWDALFQYYGKYEASYIWTGDSIAAARRKLNISYVLLTVMMSLLGMHTVESLLFRKKGNEGAHEQVFISYNHKNQPQVLQLAALLKEAGIETVIDVDKNVAGDKIDKDFIRKSVYDSAIIVLVVSKESLLSGWVSIEAVSSFLLSTLDTRRKIIPCSLDESFREKGFGTEAMRQIDQQIATIDEDSRQREGAGSGDNDAKRKRLVKLRDNLDEILENLDETLCVDISGDKLQQNFPKILDAIEKKFEENREAGS